jgi:uncharacterized protein (TIGR00297 family)
MASPVDSDASNLTAKAERERRLGWQSHLLLGLVVAATVIAAAGMTASARTAATAEGVGICAAFGGLVWLVRAATPGAAATGFLLTLCLYLRTVEQPGGGWFHTALLPGLALFALAFAATRFQRGQKERTGLAESRRGRRASQVAANMGAAALAAVAVPFLAAPESVSSTFNGHAFVHYPSFAPILFAPLVAALAEAAADTVSSEIGQAIGGDPWLVISLQRVPPGTDGAVSAAGTAAGLIASGIVALAAVPTLRLDWRQDAMAWLAGIAGLFADTLLGATLERRGWLNNDAVNFLSTAVAAGVALVALGR